MEEKLEMAVDRFKFASEISLKQYKKPIVVEYSGGKDSDALVRVAEISGVPFTLHHSLTTVDPPPVIRHIKEVFAMQEEKGRRTEIDYHVKEDGTRLTMWNLIPVKLMPPTRRVRYCCQGLKETGNKNSLIITGVRWAESSKRAKRNPYEVLGKGIKNSVGISDEKMLLTDNDDTRKFMEVCQMKSKVVVNPIINWDDVFLLEFLNNEKVSLCEMYGWGYKRLGCIGCPMARKSQREREFYDFPKYKQLYIHAFDRMIEERKRKEKKCEWKCGTEVFRWWMQDNSVPGQITIEDFPEVFPENDY